MKMKHTRMGAPVIDVPAEAKKIVADHLQEFKLGATAPEDLYIVWSSKTLQNWKAVVSAPTKDFPLIEVTHNGDKNVTYVDMYMKVLHREVRKGEQ